MKRNIYNFVLTGVLLTGLTGCTSHKEAKIEAHKRWQGTRARMLLGVGEEQFKVGDLSNARNCAKESLSLVPDLSAAQILLARIAIEKGDYAKADRHLTAADSSLTDGPQITYLKAVVKERQGKLAEALQLYEKARALEPNNPAPVLASAEVLVALNRPEEALELVESKATSVDESLCMYRAAGELAMLTGKPDRAVEHFRQVRYLAPEDPAIQENLAKAYFFNRQYGNSIALLKTLRTRPEYEGYAWLNSMLGSAYLATDAPREAKACFDRAVALDPGNPRHWTDQATAALHCRDLPRAALSATQALHLDPGAVEARIILGYALLAQGRNTQANQLLTRAVEKHPEQATLQCLLGRSYAALGDKKKADACYEATLKLEPDNTLALQLLACAKE